MNTDDGTAVEALACLEAHTLRARFGLPLGTAKKLHAAALAEEHRRHALSFSEREVDVVDALDSELSAWLSQHSLLLEVGPVLATEQVLTKAAFDECTIDELIAAGVSVEAVAALKCVPPSVLAAFQYFDSNDSGFLDYQELRYA